MTPFARIQAAIDIVAEILETDRPAEGIVSAYCRARRFMGSKDRQAISGRVWRIVRSYHRLSWWAKRTETPADARIFVIADLMFGGEHNARSLDAAFSGDRFAPDTLMPFERKFADAIEGQALDHPDMDARTRAECPDWAFDGLQAALGDKFDQEMRATLTPAPVDLRVNLLKATRDEVLEVLERDGFEAAPGRLSPFAIRLAGRPQISQHPLYHDGVIEIQDEGSQMVAVLADPKPGEQVADYCAGAGGKTLAMGAMMKNKGRIVALDVLGRRLESGRERFRRAGLHNVETRELSETGDKFVKRHAGHFDLVLVDAPCSGTGTWRRDPDRRWRAMGPKLPELVALQADILHRAQKMVKPGGRLVYATCSMLAEENDRQADVFLAAHPEFESARRLTLTPARDDTDGFFAAVMIRKGGAGA